MTRLGALILERLNAIPGSSDWDRRQPTMEELAELLAIQADVTAQRAAAYLRGLPE